MSSNFSYVGYLDEVLTDPREASEYLNAALEDEEPEVFLLALKDVARAQGGRGEVARRCKLNRENLYRMLSRSGNPRLRGLEALLGACGLRIRVEPRKPAARAARRRR